MCSIRLTLLFFPQFPFVTYPKFFEWLQQKSINDIDKSCFVVTLEMISSKRIKRVLLFSIFLKVHSSSSKIYKMRRDEGIELLI